MPLLEPTSFSGVRKRTMLWSITPKGFSWRKEVK
jgi:hypothetical protein